MDLPLPGRRPSRAETAVFVSGVTSMGLEILAGRILAPAFGNSIYTWGGVIGVFLAALSLGYHRGGRRAARNASYGRLACLFLATALYVAGVILLGDAVVGATELLPLPGEFASLPAITLLFGPPTYLLGYVSPYTAELAGGDVGATAGHVYAVGTVGSIVGAFGTTYLLVPTLSVAEIGLVLGLSAVGAAAAVAAPDLRGTAGLRVVVVALALVAATVTGGVGPAVGGETVYATQTAYQELRVVDRGDVRTLYLDGQRHSAMDLDDPTRHVFEYTRYFHAPLLFADDPDEVDRSWLAHILVSEDEDRLDAAVDRIFPLPWGEESDMEDQQLSTAEDARERGSMLIGTPSQVAEQIEGIHDLGFDKLQLMFLDFPETRGMELFADEVMDEFN